MVGRQRVQECQECRQRLLERLIERRDVTSHPGTEGALIVILPKTNIPLQHVDQRQIRNGRTVRDRVTGKGVRLPEEKIGQLLVLVPQQDASIALVTQSTGPINIGDSVRNRASR